MMAYNPPAILVAVAARQPGAWTPRQPRGSFQPRGAATSAWRAAFAQNRTGLSNESPTITELLNKRQRSKSNGTVSQDSENHMGLQDARSRTPHAFQHDPDELLRGQ